MCGNSRSTAFRPTNRFQCTPQINQEIALWRHFSQWWNIESAQKPVRRWLPVRQRATFKPAVLIFKVLHGLAPHYLADDCQLVTDSGRCHLRSSESATCVLQRTNTRFGDRAFRLAGPSVWNSLPADLRHPNLSWTVPQSAKNVFV